MNNCPDMADALSHVASMKDTGWTATGVPLTKIVTEDRFQGDVGGVILQSVACLAGHHLRGRSVPIEHEEHPEQPDARKHVKGIAPQNSSSGSSFVGIVDSSG